jgi:hypothetical protein
MIQKFDLIAGSIDEIKEYIEGLDTFDSWQLGKGLYSQVENLLSRDCLFKHIGPVTYQGRNSDRSVIIHAAFIAVERNPYKFA